MAQSFKIFTLVTSALQYNEMCTAFRRQGFDDTYAEYVELNNEGDNKYEPYSIINAIVGTTEQPYIIICHQDITPNEGETVNKLIQKLSLLQNLYPQWMVAGNAGMNWHGKGITHLDDPSGSTRQSHLPHEVLSLDENFLVIKSQCGLQTTPGLSGFHFYGTDICLNAIANGGGAYVIDYLVTHKSSGFPASPSFLQIKDSISNKWRKRLSIGLIRTTCAQMILSSNTFIEKLIQKYPTCIEYFFDKGHSVQFIHPFFGRTLSPLITITLHLPLIILWKLKIWRKHPKSFR